jgi:hypothetical protein
LIRCVRAVMRYVPPEGCRIRRRQNRPADPHEQRDSSLQCQLDDPSRSTLAFQSFAGYSKISATTSLRMAASSGRIYQSWARPSVAPSATVPQWPLIPGSRVQTESAPRIAPRWAEEWKENVERFWYGGDFNFSETEQGCRNQDAIYQRNDH